MGQWQLKAVSKQLTNRVDLQRKTQNDMLKNSKILILGYPKDELIIFIHVSQKTNEIRPKREIKQLRPIFFMMPEFGGHLFIGPGGEVFYVDYDCYQKFANHPCLIFHYVILTFPFEITPIFQPFGDRLELPLSHS